MSGNGKKGRKKSGSNKELGVNLGDVTLADYANSNVLSGKGRLKKAKTALNIVQEVKELKIVDKEWDKIIDDFEGDFDFVKEKNEDGKEVYVMKKAHKKTLSDSLESGCKGRNIYPLDIWHLIGGYIRPEDIYTFSAICKDSWAVTNTPAFWFNLYKRYYKKVPNLPERLKPECMVRHHGLKACVVRSLFYMYPPLASRIDGASMATPYELKSTQCISMWQERLSNCKWRLNFKLRRKNCHPKTRTEEEPNLMEILGDIFANADDGCTLLQVSSAERMVMPNVMGLTLHSINIGLEMTMSHTQVQLVFGSGRICNGKLDTIGTETLSLKKVLQVAVLDWWHPRYPHSSSIIIHGNEA